MSGPVDRVVLDTNVLVAAAYRPDSASRRLIEAALSGRVIAFISPEVKGEYEFIIDRATRGSRYRPALAQFIAGATPIEPAAESGFVPEDPADDKFVALASAAGAVLVSSDRHVLSSTHRHDVPVLTPGEVTLPLD